MPLKFSFKKLPVDENGIAYKSLEEFQVAELKKLFVNSQVAADEKIELNEAYAKAVMALRDEITEILELTMDARPGARGVSKKRKPKATEPASAAEPAPASEPTPAPQ